MKEAEKLICGTLTVALFAYCVANQVDPVVAATMFTHAAIDTAVQGIQFGWNIVKIAAKSTAIVGGSYIALKATIAGVNFFDGKINKCRFATKVVTIAEDESEQSEESEELEVELLDENDASESDDEDFEEVSENEESAQESFTIEPEDAFNPEELAGLLADQKRVVFLHGAIKLPALTAVKSVIKGPYRLRPRA